MEVSNMTMVGKGIPKYDGIGHVTGTTKYVNDYYVPGTLICKGLRSPVAKGRVKSIDTSEAEKLPGVYAVITAKDIPHNVFGGNQPVIAENIRFKGELIAAVAAIDEDTAQKAVSLIKADIEEETPVFDPIEAMKPDAPKVRPEGNVLMFGDKDYYLVRCGNVEEGFKEADVIVESEYVFPAADQTPLETQTSLAIPHPNGSLTVYTTSQCLYGHLTELCNILQMPFSKVNYVGGTIGGGFGAKNDLHADPVVAVLALKTGKPVKWVWTREEELTVSSIRGGWIMKIKDGVKKDGRIVARQMECILDGGAYLGFNEYATTKHAFYCVGPYYIPNVEVKTRCVFTNKPLAGPMRGFALTGCAFAADVHIQKDAEAIGMDPFRIRMINALRKGEPIHANSVPPSLSAIEVMQKIAEEAGVKLSDDLLAMSSEGRRA